MFQPGALISLVITDPLIVGAIVAFFYLMAFVCAVREIMYSRTSQGSIAWLLSLLLAPFPTSILYFIFGWKLFDDYAAVQSHSGRGNRIAQAHKHAMLDEDANTNWRTLAAVAQMPFVSGNSAELLIDGNATFDSIFAGIDRAERVIYAQFYIIRDDRLGREFATRLIARARAGVAVYLLYDDVGCFWLPRSYMRRLAAEGIKCAPFNKRHKMLRLFGPARLQYRNHRKLVLVDGKEAWIGGHNVGVEYLGEDPRFGRWRDTHVHVSGAVALSCAQMFHEDWEWATGEKLPRPLEGPPERVGEESILVMPSGPADRIEECSIAFSEVISRARKRLWLVSPYFVPDLDMRTALYAAVLRGVDVRVLIPERPDHMLVWLASIAHAGHMLAHDVQIYQYPEGFLHEKVILMDDEIAGVGTVNFDNRSFSINFEVTLWFIGRKMVSDVIRMLEADFAAAKPFTAADRKSVAVWRRFIGEAARLFSPIL
ncbi:MAG TPA: cardiolipin synthase [Alphaproteobacteria bacterium]|nr:cardiolipin synthase [Alphaproteobacteria bacterium]